LPTFEALPRFWRDYDRLSPEQRAAFQEAVEKFVDDLGQARLRPGLRVKGIQGAKGIFEVTWANDGPATFQFGESIRPGEPHVIWRRCGTHEILAAP